MTGLVKDNLLGCVGQVLTAGCQARVGGTSGTLGPEIKVRSYRESTEFGRMAKGD